MQLSAEIRWFWKASAPAGLVEWFQSKESHPCAAGGGSTPRTDLYRRDAKQVELAMKLRGNKPGYEVKGLIEQLAPLAEAPFVGAAELWCKWSTEGLRFDAQEMIATTKLRWIRKLDTASAEAREVELGPDEKAKDEGDFPKTGCQVELTQITVGAHAWWSFSFESFGTIATVERDLRAGAAIMAARRPPPLTDGLLASYPAWLKDRVTEP
jgi:hypothetical protein